MRNTAILFFVILLQACVSYEPQIRNDISSENISFPEDEEIVQSFVLIGDVGESTATEGSGLEAMAAYLDSVREPERVVLFLGDNTNASSLLSEDPRQQQEARIKLDRQAGAVKDHPGRPVFIPGELDWEEEGIAGLEAEKEYLQEILKNESVFMPRTGCPLQFVDISNDVHLIILDSQWYLNNWDEHPTINDDCPEIKTRAAMITELETELKKNQNKTTVLAMHHPLYSNGVHGGNFYLTPYLQPSIKKNVLPVAGSLAMLFRTSGGLSPQDLHNERYKNLRDKIRTIAGKWGRVVFASGHDHSLQYIEQDHVKQIVSGSGSINSPAGLRNNGLFAYPNHGFAVFDVFEDGSSRVNFYGNKNGKPLLLFQKQVFSKPVEFNIDSLPARFPATKTTAVYEDQKETIKDFGAGFWGDGYRDLYIKDIQVPVADLDTLYGGLEPVRMGGGNQTVSLRVRDSLQREYNFRKIRKDPVQFIQTALYPEQPVSEYYEGTLLETLIKGFYTASHPFGFMVVPTLSDAAEVLHTNPELYYLPKQPKLGKFNFEHGNDLYMIEERPEDHWLGYDSFGSPNHDIQSTAGLLERLRRDEQYSLDESSYIRARIFDMFLGDWDRHNDQWRWAETELENGNRVFEPIPRDRDQVFASFDGTLFKTMRALVGITKKFTNYGEDIENLQAFNRQAKALDRSLLKNTGRKEWIAEAEFLQKNLTNGVIEEAFSQLPEEVRGDQHTRLIETVKGRRDNLVDIATRYYNHLSDLVVLTATDKDDFVDITRMDEGKTRVRISRNKDGERAEVVVDNIFFEEDTKEIVIYALDDDDQFHVEGDAESEIFIRLVGGQDNDLYNIRNGNQLKIYDHASQPNTLKKKGGARVLFTDDYQVNLYQQDRRPPSGSSILPSLVYNPDQGFVPEIAGSFSSGNLVEYPFKTKHLFGVRYFSATKGFDIDYALEFKNFKGKYNYLLGGYYSSPGHTQNFFGYGNETENPDKELSLNYNRIRLEELKAQAGFVRENSYGSYFRYVASLEAFEIRNTPGRFITEEFSQQAGLAGRDLFAGLEGNYRYEGLDDALDPSSGLIIDIKAAGKTNIEEFQPYAYLNPYFEFYNAISRNRRWVLHSRIQGQVNFGNNYPLYHAATLGGDTGLRGYRRDRFAGKQAFAAGTDLTYRFGVTRTSFLPFQVRIFGGYDIGRVWFPGEESNTWHHSYGGGFKLNIPEALGTTFRLYSGEEGWRFTFGIGKRF